MSSDYCDRCECAIVDGACNCTGYEMLSSWGELAVLLND